MAPGAAAEAVGSELSFAGLREPDFALAKEVAFAPVAGPSLVDLTVKRLFDVIAMGVIEVGEMLPSEPELAERLGVSMATLREALAILRQSQLIATKRGRGGGTVVIRSVEPPPAQEAKRLLASRSVDQLRDLGDYRLAIAGQAAALAADRSTPREIEILESMAMHVARDSGLANYRRGDAQIHIAIATVSRSARLAAGETTVYAELGDYMSLVARPTVRVDLANKQHQKILSAIRQRDVKAARASSEEHVRTTTALLIEARSELADRQAERTVDYFSGIRPYGSELGSTPAAVHFEADDKTIRRRRPTADGRTRM